MSWLLAGVLLVHQVTGATPHLPRSQKRWASGRWGVCPLGGCGCVPASCCTPSAEQRAWGSIQTGSMGASARRSPGHQRVSWSMRDAPHMDTVSQSGVPHKQLCPFICPSVCSECSGVWPSATGVIWSVCDACLGFPRVGWRSREIIFSAWRLWNRHLGIPTCGGQRGRAGVSIRQTRETRS